MIEDLKNIHKQALSEISSAEDAAVLEELRIKYLGRKSAFTQLMKRMSEVSKEDRPKIGKMVNDIKNEITDALDKKLSDSGKSDDLFDISFPAKKMSFGTKHPLTIVIDEVCKIFSSLGFIVDEGHELEDEWYNFEALNVPSDHTSRDEVDTFYLNLPNNSEGWRRLLRCHTSPRQIRTMKNNEPPFAVISPGRVYRPDSVDASHSFMFHQIEGFAVSETIDLSHLKGVLVHFIKELFGENVELRFRPSYFPFTEPSTEVDMSCIICGAKGCSVCKQSGWLEVLGSGMIHPNVLESCGVDTKKYRGFAFGMGVERLAMLKYGIDDIRLFYENDTRFLNQFYEI